MLDDAAVARASDSPNGPFEIGHPGRLELFDDTVFLLSGLFFVMIIE